MRYYNRFSVQMVKGTNFECNSIRVEKRPLVFRGVHYKENKGHY